MNMPMTDVMTAKTGAVKSEMSKGSPIAGRTQSNAATSEAGSFEQLLMQIAGGEKTEQLLGQNNPAILMLLQSQISFMNADSSEELAKLLAWLDEALQLMKNSSGDMIQWLEQNPETTQLLAAFTSMLTTMNASGTSHASTEAQVAQPAVVQAKLTEVLQQFRQQLANGQLTEEAAGHIRTLQQLMQPVVGAGNGQAVHTHQGSDTFGMQMQTAKENFNPLNANQAQRSEQSNSANSGKPLAANIGSQELVQALTKSSAPTTAASTMMPRAELLRPELLTIALNDSADGLTGEVKLFESTSTAPLMMNDTAKTADQLIAARVQTAQQVPVEQFAEELNKFVLKSFQVTQLNGLAEAKISLVPEHLGHVDIKLTMQNGHLVAQLVTETALGREMLEQQLGALRSALQGQGIQVDKLEVTSQANSASTPFFREQDQSQQSRHFEQQSRSHASPYEEDAVDFEQELEMIGNDYEAYMGGRSFHATA